MKVVILCGGLGTRLREETEYRPKPMVPIGGRPILWHIMKHYAHYGHKEFVLCLGYKGDVIKDFFRNYLWHTSDVTMRLGRNPEIRYHNTHEEEDWSVTLLETGLHTMTGGRLRRALQFLPDQEVLFTYGDGLTDSDPNRVIEFHRSQGATATLTAVRPVGRFGELQMDDHRIRAFAEKPDLDAWVSGGFFVLNRAILDVLDPSDDCILERAPLARLASSGKLCAYKHAGYWQCMDTYREHLLLNEQWDSGQAPWKVWGA